MWTARPGTSRGARAAIPTARTSATSGTTTTTAPLSRCLSQSKPLTPAHTTRCYWPHEPRRTRQLEARDTDCTPHGRTSDHSGSGCPGHDAAETSRLLLRPRFRLPPGVVVRDAEQLASRSLLSAL